ncbi:malate dehydrogenase [Hahella ganghwensis]|uniref:malate dehydrogenase n=1 Tax=Hahella ganghwensis TaxID=286420 RepID=UPI000376E18E|nr:malate dehydrogenase [Hahella ganghwensis]
MTQPLTVAVTGAAGSVCQSLLFRLAAGEPFGQRPIRLQLIERPEAMQVLRGLAMELEDCAFPLLESVTLHDSPETGFVDCDYALLVGAKPRSAGMQRIDLLKDNAEIFAKQGKALGQYAKPTVKVLVVGNPANTNALIAWANAERLSPSQLTVLMRLDHNRAKGFLSRKLGVSPQSVERLAVWGNHASTQFPDANHVHINGQPLRRGLDIDWYREIMIGEVQLRGEAVINVKGRTSAASAAQAIIDHLRDWMIGTSTGDFVSMGVFSHGEYGVAPGLFFSFPVTCRHGHVDIVEGLELDDFCKKMIRETEQELLRERQAVLSLLPEKSLARRGFTSLWGSLDCAE